MPAQLLFNMQFNFLIFTEIKNGLLNHPKLIKIIFPPQSMIEFLTVLFTGDISQKIISHKVSSCFMIFKLFVTSCTVAKLVAGAFTVGK